MSQLIIPSVNIVNRDFESLKYLGRKIWEASYQGLKVREIIP